MIVIANVGDAETAVTEAIMRKPNIVLMDVDLPGLNAFAATGIILEAQPQTRIVFLSAFSHDSYIDQAIRAKAWAYVTKTESFRTICHAIREVHRGWVYFSSGIKERIVNTPDGPKLSVRTTTPAATLTARELETLGYVARGMSTKEIAQTMHISTKTVDNHKTALMNKLGVHDRVALARFAFREGIASP